jgi:hypothetical protein
MRADFGEGLFLIAHIKYGGDLVNEDILNGFFI